MPVPMDMVFPHSYEIEHIDDFPPSEWTRHYYPGTSIGGRHDGIILKVFPAREQEWLGVFGVARESARIYSTPDPNRFCIAGKMEGYLVNADHPESWEEVLALPIRDVRCIPASDLIVFADFTELVAYGPKGLRWKTERLAYDDVKIIEVDDDSIKCTGFHAPGSKTIHIAVDLATGRHKSEIK